VPHDGVFHPQLRRHCMAQGRAHANSAFQGAVHQDFLSRTHFLLVRRGGQHLPPLPPRLLQPGHRRHHALLHGHLRLFGDPPPGELAHLPRTSSGCCRRYHC